jgi:hypothetical protein
MAQGKLTLGRVVATVTAVDADYGDCGLAGDGAPTPAPTRAPTLAPTRAAATPTTAPTKAPQQPTRWTFDDDDVAHGERVAVCAGAAETLDLSLDARAADDDVGVSDALVAVLDGGTVRVERGAAVVVEVALASAAVVGFDLYDDDQTRAGRAGTPSAPVRRSGSERPRNSSSERGPFGSFASLFHDLRRSLSHQRSDHYRPR